MNAHDLAVRLALRGALLRQAEALIAQAGHLGATLEAELPAMTPPAATDLRFALAQQDTSLLEVVIPDTALR